MKNQFSNLNSKNVKSFFSQNSIYISLLLLIILIAIKDPSFMSLNVFRDILLQNSTRVIIACGMACVLISGGTDLSAGRMVGFAAVISASMLQVASYARRFYPGLPQLPVYIPILIAILAGVVIGLMNGLFISKFEIPPFITTLGTMVVIYGMNSLYFDMPPNSSQPIGGIRKDFTVLGSGYISFVPVIVIIAIVIALITWIVLNKTPFGKNVYAIGGNKEAAIVSGINVKGTLLAIYAIAGALYALGGVLEAARTGGATNNYGNMYELDAIAACVVGGVSTAGGIGTVTGIITGVLIFGVINYGLTFIGISPYWQLIIKGFIIVAAVGVDIRKYIAKR